MKKAAIVLLLLVAPPVHAADPVFNAGFLEVMSLPDTDHIGAYGYVGGSLLFPVNDELLLIPGLSVEFSPEVQGEPHWGLVGTFIGSYSVAAAGAIDGIVTILHDQVGGDFGGATVFAGLGLGYTHGLGKLTISPSISVYYDLVTGSGASIAPLLNVGYAL